MKHSMEKQKVSYYELEGTYREIGRQIAGQEDTGKWYIPAPEYFTREALEEALGLYDMYSVSYTHLDVYKRQCYNRDKQ